MPTIIPYPAVLQSLQRSGLRCNYHNSGAFGLPPDNTSHILGWCAADDPTIRPEMRQHLRIIAPPTGQTLATLLNCAWQRDLPGPLWLMPASHWAFELEFGAADWLPPLLEQHGIDPQLLRPLADGSAIEFQPEEAQSLTAFVQTLFERMTASDFTAAFPGRAVVAMLHHHQQIWWQTSDAALHASLDSVLGVL